MKARIDPKKPEAREQTTLRLREAFSPASPTPVPPGDDDPAARVERAERFGHHLGRLQAGGSAPPSLVHGVFPGRSSQVIQRSSEEEDFESKIKGEKTVLEENDDLLEEEDDPQDEEEDNNETSNQKKFEQAVEDDEFELAAQLLQEKDVDINSAGEYGTLLYQAAENEDEAKVLFLLTHNANVDIPDPSFGETPLFAAVKSGSASIVRLLLEKGADPNLPDNDQTAPVHKAVEGENLEILNLLVEKKPNLNVPNSVQQTPLHIAVDKKNQAIVKLLVEHGADMTARDELERTPLENVPGRDTELRSSLRGSYPVELKKAFVQGFHEYLAHTPPRPVEVKPTQSPAELEKVLRSLTEDRYQAFEAQLSKAAPPEQETLVKSDVGYHKDLLEFSIPSKDALKFLGHVHSLEGTKNTGLLKIDLEGFISRDAIFHNILALQSYLEKIGSSQETAKKAEAVTKRIQTLVISYQRGLDLQLAHHFFKTLGLPEETTSEIYGSVAQAVSSQEVSSGQELLLPVGFSGKDSGHAIYLGGRGDFKEGKGELTVHNLGALSENHPKGPSKGRLSSSFPLAVTGIAEGKDLTVWLQSVISALTKDEAGPAEQALYKESPKLGKTPGTEELGQQLSPQMQQVVGNCSVKNLHSFLLTSLQRELGLEEGQKLYKEIKEQVKAFAKTSVEEHVEKEDEPLSLSIQEMLTKDLPQKQLRNAVLKQDNQRLAKILEQHKSLNLDALVDSEKTPLAFVIENRDLKAIALLLGHGAQMAGPAKESTVLACWRDQIDVISALLEGGVNPDLDFLKGMTLLQVALAEPKISIEMIQQILKAKPNVNANGGKGAKTPLHWAAEKKNQGAVSLLLEKGADPKAQDAAQKLPYQLAEENGDLELAKLLKPQN